jgi:hypothetical protein
MEMPPSIVQKTSQINTTGSAVATATFAQPLTAGNLVVLVVGATDNGGAVASDGPGDSFAAITDTLGLSFTAPSQAPWIFGDRTNNLTLFFGAYFAPIGSGGSDSITFTFTPVSSAPNCQVGIVCYELHGVSTNESLDGSETVTSWPMGAVESVSVSSPGAFVVDIGVAFTTDGTNLTHGPGYSAMDAVAGAHLGSTFSTIGSQSELLSSGSASAEFTTPTSSDGLSNIAMVLGFNYTTHTISGSVGIAGVTISYSGDASGTSTTDAFGRYSIPSLAVGNYTITPSLSGYTFLPASSSQTISTANITGVNFSGSSNPNIRQSAVASGAQSNVSPMTVPFLAANLSGDSILVFVEWYATSVTIAVQDSQGNSYASLHGPDVESTSNIATQVFLAQGIKSGANTVTITPSTSVNMIACVVEDTSLATTPFDKWAQAQQGGGSSTTVLDSGSTGATSQPKDVVYGYGGNTDNNNSFSSGGSYTLVNQIGSSVGGGQSFFVEYLEVSTTGVQDATGTQSIATSSGAGGWNMGVIALKRNASPGPGSAGWMNRHRNFVNLR